MSSRRSTAHDLSAAELEALLHLRMARLPDEQLNRLLPDHTPSEIVRRFCTTPITNISRRRIDSALRELERMEVQVVTVANEDYPARLQKLEGEKPPMLFYRGDYELVHAQSIAVVGTRRSTEYGNAATELLVADLTRYGLGIISGLALGIDTQAHRTALEAGGNTIAVLGCGIDVWYPQRNAPLQERIATAGLLLSEFVPGEPALPHHFLQRNRLIALLAGGVLVVEAGMKSGTRNTVDWALRYGINVFAVPGPIGRDASCGTNALIQDGAIMVTCVRDIVEQLPWRLQPESTSAISSTPDFVGNPAAGAILKVLGPVGMQIDQIARAARCPTSDALALLAELELDGFVRQLPGKRFAAVQVRTAG